MQQARCHTVKQAAALQKQQVARPVAPSLSPAGRQTLARLLCYLQGLHLSEGRDIHLQGE